LNTNTMPMDSEVYFIRSIISASDGQLAMLNREMALFRDRMQSLADEHTQLLSYCNKNRGIISPLRRMPPELLQEIFSWTVPLAQDSRNGAQTSITESPWNLSHVCKLWREVSIGTPSLWSLIAI
ncbi:hypothetical protein K438DRAFT_1483234, partial [Mycena galopus ATCC 62051]